MVVNGYQGADEDSEKLSLTDRLLDAAELAVVNKGQPYVLAGCFNVEPTRNPLLEVIMAKIWFDLQGAWARASGVDRGLTCKLGQFWWH